MIGAIVTSMDEDHLLVIPSGNADLESLVGRSARYVDKSGKIWPAVVSSVEEPGVIIKFTVFPSGLGQGQIVDIIEESEDSQAFLSKAEE
jgi:hypothetical protein